MLNPDLFSSSFGRAAYEYHKMIDELELREAVARLRVLFADGRKAAYGADPKAGEREGMDFWRAAKAYLASLDAAPTPPAGLNGSEPFLSSPALKVVDGECVYVEADLPDLEVRTHHAAHLVGVYRFLPDPRGGLESSAFAVGQAVVKDGGDYTFQGIVVSFARKRSGQIRYLVESEIIRLSGTVSVVGILSARVTHGHPGRASSSGGRSVPQETGI